MRSKRQRTIDDLDKARRDNFALVEIMGNLHRGRSEVDEDVVMYALGGVMRSVELGSVLSPRFSASPWR